MNWPPNEERILITLKNYRPGQIIPGRNKNVFYRVMERACFGAYIVRPYDPTGRKFKHVAR